MGEHVSAAIKSMRLNVLRLAAQASAKGGGAHIASSLSIIEILAVLHLKIMRPEDVFILSKGHGGLAYYTALKESGAISGEVLDSFDMDGGVLPGQPTKAVEHGIVFSGGSLGMGLSYACGLAMAEKMKKNGRMVYVLLGDGELNEGSVWEAVMLSRQLKLDNLVAVIDLNGMQSDGVCSEIVGMDAGAVFSAFGWQTYSCDGHDVDELSAVFATPLGGVPKVIIAKTIKGKGVSFMENNNIWHHNRLNAEQYRLAAHEVEQHGV